MRPILFTTLTIGIMTSALAQAPTSAPVTAPAPAPIAQDSKLANASDKTASDADQTIRCRTIKVTGSLVKKGRVCKTLAEWRRIIEAGNDIARRLVEDGMSRPGAE
jgi:hypothetical protein